jgi:DNA polymerase-3 subunit gamma/tau
VGQDAVVRTLRTALASGKLAHAYLFSGPRGSGKTSAAKILARCIDCVNGPTPDPDNTCANCQAILAGTALDVLEIDAASNRGIDEIRALRESVKFAPASMRSKVFIIDEAHMLTREGANAFLKTLEEPPAHVVFILATTAPEALPPTILSRCQRYAFRRIPVATMIERMREIAKAEGIEIDGGALGAIAYRADGGLRDALTMLEQVAAYGSAGTGSEGVITAATVDAAFGTTGRVYARSLVEAILAGDASTALRTVDGASDAGADMQGLIRTAIGEYRNLLVARIDPELLDRDLASDDAERTRALAAATPQVKVVRGLRLLADALAAGRISGNPRLEVETAVLRLIVQGEDPSLEALATRVALLEGHAPARAAAPAPPAVAETKKAPALKEPARKGSPAPEPESRAPMPEPAAPGSPPSLQQIRSLWDHIRNRAYEKYMPLRTPLSRATVDALEGDLLTVGLVDETQAGFAKGKQSVLEDALADVVGTRLRVVFRTGATSARSSAHRATPASASEPDGESDLLAYARVKLMGAPDGTETE